MNHSFSPLLPTTGENEEQQKLTVNMKDPPFMIFSLVGPLHFALFLATVERK